jgi:predicted nuclease of predicted toxin-antitoxin system
MKIIIDECLAKSTRTILKNVGYEIINIEDVLEPGVEDEKIFEYCARKRIPIITHDRGFGILFYFSKNLTPTIVILQVLSPHPEETNKLLKKSLDQIDLRQLEKSGKLIIISRSNIRIRTK